MNNYDYDNIIAYIPTTVIDAYNEQKQNDNK